LSNWRIKYIIWIYISYASYFKRKNNFKSLIINHTRICALKPLYSFTRVKNLTLTTLLYILSDIGGAIKI
jgi:hypothetical protein